jgi:chromosome segregation ATPase
MTKPTVDELLKLCDMIHDKEAPLWSHHQQIIIEKALRERLAVEQEAIESKRRFIARSHKSEKSETQDKFVPLGCAGKEAHDRLDYDWYQGYDAWQHVDALREEKLTLEGALQAMGEAAARLANEKRELTQSLATAREAINKYCEEFERSSGRPLSNDRFGFAAIRATTESGGGET